MTKMVYSLTENHNSKQLIVKHKCGETAVIDERFGEVFCPNCERYKNSTSTIRVNEIRDLFDDGEYYIEWR